MLYSFLLSNNVFDIDFLYYSFVKICCQSQTHREVGTENHGSWV